MYSRRWCEVDGRNGWEKADEHTKREPDDEVVIPASETDPSRIAHQPAPRLRAEQSGDPDALLDWAKRQRHAIAVFRRRANTIVPAVNASSVMIIRPHSETVGISAGSPAPAHSMGTASSA